MYKINNETILKLSDRRPNVDRSCKPPVDHFTSVGDLEMKTVYIPAELIDKFLILAQSNTSQSVETCGILCGKLVNYLLCVSLCCIRLQCYKMFVTFVLMFLTYESRVKVELFLIFVIVYIICVTMSM